MTDGYFKCNKCSVFFHKLLPHIAVTEVEIREPIKGVISVEYEPNIKHYCSACKDKVYNP